MLDDGHFDIVGVVTQPDRPAGRKMQMTKSPVRLLAEKHGLRILTPEKMNLPENQAEVLKWGGEVAVVVAFGQILNTQFLNMFTHGCVNVHASLLPRWRGAAPIQRAIEAGDKITGVALQKMVKELDAGDVLGVRKIPITEDMNSKELHDALAPLGADLLKVDLMDYIRGNLIPEKQDAQFVTYAKKIDKSESLVDWESTQKIHNKVRAFVWGPGNYFLWNQLKVKIHKTKIIDRTTTPLKPESIGSVINVSDLGIDVQTGLGIVRLLELQPESRNKMYATEFIKGYGIKVGDKV
jgi:methionyl-tRNA formyltransferase